MQQLVNDPLRKELREVFANPDVWLETENDQLGGRKPKDLIAEGREQWVYDLVQAIKHGMFT